MTDRRQESYAVRLEAAELSRSRQHSVHQANGDEQKYAGDKYFMSFTKGLPHNPDTGLLHDANDFVEFRRAIDDGFIDPFTDKVRHGAKYDVTIVGGEYDACPVQDPPNNFRQWEAPTAGVVFELQGPDAQAVTMPPAPPLLGTDGQANPELVLEMAEVYELAILRDKPFNAFEDGVGDADINASLARLNALHYVQNQTGRPHKVAADGNFDLQTVFRGSSPGVEIGPYLSQFMLIGNTDLNNGGSVAEGIITYGVLQIDQKVPIAKPGKDFMTDIETYVKVQRGLKPDPSIDKEKETYVLQDGVTDANPPDRPGRRFIYTPRDLATYVHYDALYEAYLNACLILLGMKTPFDPAFDHLSGGGEASKKGNTRRHANGFALYGGPHILTLVTEVATRALKAVRFQKFNNHIRLRPEALAARIELTRIFDTLSDEAKVTVPKAFQVEGDCKGDVVKFKEALQETLNALPGGKYFLPMAFPEGSPMHPAYGAGHATVAGACVTILKAFFDTSAVLAKKDGKVAFKRYESGDEAILYRVDASDTSKLISEEPCHFLTLEGELNKLAANISIGRDMAGVHYFTDYYDSLRMGEEIAIGILEEQALTYSTDPFVLSIPTFDGPVVRIGRR